MARSQTFVAGRDERWVGVAAACTILGVHPSTLREWTAQGRLPAFLTPGGHRRFREADLRALRGQPPDSAVGRSLAAAILTVQPRCGLSSAMAGATYPWLARCDAEQRQRLRLLGGSLARLLARYVVAEGDPAERLLWQAREDASEYGTLASALGLSPATAIEAFTVCRAPMVEAAEQWAAQAYPTDRRPHVALDRISRFLDVALLSMVRALEGANGSPEH